MKFESVMSASKKFLVTRETMSVFPSLPAIARLVDATIELRHAIDPDEKESLGARVAIGLLRQVLEVGGDVTMFWKKWIRG